jgi:hypothetical protein
LIHISSLFCSDFFGDRVLQTICLGWPRTATLPILASQVARITGVSNWYPVTEHFLKVEKKCWWGCGEVVMFVHCWRNVKWYSHCGSQFGFLKK